MCEPINILFYIKLVDESGGFGIMEEVQHGSSGPLESVADHIKSAIIFLHSLSEVKKLRKLDCALRSNLLKSCASDGFIPKLRDFQ